MVKKLVGIGISAGAVLLVACALLFALTPHSTSPAASTSDTTTTSLTDMATSVISDAKNDAINAAMDNSGAKTAVQNTLLEHSEDIANKTGLAESQVQTIITDIDVPSWEVTDLPANAVATKEISGTYAGVNAEITTYDDPNYISVNAYGQNFTLQVPQSAQQYMSLLSFIQ